MSAVQERNYLAEVARMDERSSTRFEYTERDLLIRLSEQVKALTDETRRATSAIASDIRDHESRLRILENFRWWMVGASAGAGFVGAIIARAIWH